MASVAAASPNRDPGREYVDLQNGVFHRLAVGACATRKIQPPVPIPDHLLAHMRRCVRLGVAQHHFVEWNGKSIKAVSKSFAHALSLAGLSDDVTSHTLRHTAATWLMQAGIPVWEAAGFLGMSAELVEKTYGHHHPDHLRSAASAMSRVRQARVVVGEIVREDENGTKDTA